MPTWERINANSRNTGTFAGKTQRQQDAYFEFFALDEPRHLKKLGKMIRKGWRP